jgi:hypothetical protein
MCVKCFWLMFHKHYLVLSLIILTDIMIMTSLIDKLIYILIEVRHKVIGIKRCHHGMSV